jgi:nitrate/TMAO reductase-like tetraheme cytochrome c subunit
VKNFTKWVGNSIGIIAFLYSLYYYSPIINVGVSLILGLSYLIFVRFSKEMVYLYPSSILLSFSYVSLIGLINNYYIYLLLTLPLFILLAISGYKLKDRTDYDYPTVLNVASHVNTGFVIINILLHQGQISHSYILSMILLVHTIVDVILTISYKKGWYIFSTAIAFSFVYYFILLTFIDLSIILNYYVIIALLYLLIGVRLKNRDKEELAKGIFTSAVIISIISTIIVTIVNQYTGGVLLISSIVYAFLTVIYKREDFIYLIILSVGVMVYNMMRLSEDQFYRGMVDYLFYGLLVIGIILIYPLIKRIFKYEWSIAEAISLTWQRVLYVFIPIAIILIVVLYNYTMEVTENPYFCGYCHTMNAPFKTWEKSTHYHPKIKNPSERTTSAAVPKPAGCVDCHYQPGVSNFVKGRVNGLLMVIKGITGFFPTKSHSNVSDEACLKSGCHVKKKLNKWITYKKGIRFNHDVMINQEVRGIRLKCASCHAHVVEGEHFKVSESVCYICHLMNRDKEIGTAVGTCYTCHYTEEELLGKDFVTIGNGEVQPEKCLFCHERLDRFKDAKYQHEVHINKNTDFTGRKIECLECHAEIKHGNFGG